MHTGLIKKKKKRPFLNQRHISSLKNSSERVTERRCVLKIPPQRVWRRAFPPSSYAGARAAPVCEHEAASSSLVLRAARLRVCGPRLRPRDVDPERPRRAHGPRGQHIAGNRRRGWRTRRRFIGRGGAPAASAPLPGTKRQRRRQGPLLLRPGAQGQLSGCRFRFPWPIRPSRPLCSAKGTCSRR